MVGEAVEECTGEPLGTEHLGPFVEGQIGGDQGRAALVALAAFDLPHSDRCFVKAYPAETAEAFCDGHNAAVAFFGGVPRSILYDKEGSVFWSQMERIAAVLPDADRLVA